MSNSSTAAFDYDFRQAYQKVIRQVRDLGGMLRAQRELLGQRGLDVGREPLEGMNQLAESLDKLAVPLEKLRTELDQLRELARTTQVTGSTMALDQVLSDVIDTVISLTHAERGYIVLKNPKTGDLEFQIARNMEQTDLGEDELIVSRTIVTKVSESGQSVITTNAQEDPRFAGSMSIAGYSLRSILCVPLKRKGQVTGVIYADNRLHQGIFGTHEGQLVSAFANQAAIALENARLFDQLRASLREMTTIKEFMDNVFASIGSGVIATNLEDAVTALNRAASRILDLPELEEPIGKSLWAVLPPLYAGFEHLVEEVRAYNRQQLVEVEPVLERRGQINLNLRLSPFRDANHTTQGVAIVLDDLTQLKQQQAQLGLIRRYLTPAMLDNIQTIDSLELGGVEREISVIYCDVRGFTAFSESIPPERVMEIVNRYLSVSAEAIHQYEGIIDKYMGDAVVGLYNTQLNPHEDHTRRAVQTALLMAAGVLELHQTLPPEQRLSYGIGVHTGYAVLGNVGSPSRKEFTALGEALDIAKLLQENAESGEIIISAAAYERVKDRIGADALPPRKLKDDLELAVMYRLRA